MHVVRDREAGKIRLTPVSEEEIAALHAFGVALEGGATFRYRGRGGGEDGEPFYIKFGAGGEPTLETTEVTPYFSTTKHVYEDEVMLKVEGTTDEDEQVIRGVRDMCFVGKELSFLGIEHGEQPVLEFRGGECRECGKGLVTMGESQWEICASCSELCKHTYIRGPVHANNGIGVAMGEFCTHCGRRNPEVSIPKDPMEQWVDVMRELGVTIVDPNGTTYRYVGPPKSRWQRFISWLMRPFIRSQPN
jgi:hypothetical protein